MCVFPLVSWEVTEASVHFSSPGSKVGEELCASEDRLACFVKKKKKTTGSYAIIIWSSEMKSRR